MIRVIKTNFSATKETINLLFVAKGTASHKEKPCVACFGQMFDDFDSRTTPKK